MANKVWIVTLEDGKHKIELNHGYISGKRDIFLDGKPVKLPLKSGQSFLDFGSNHSFKIGSHCCIVHIRTNGITFSFDLSVDGRSVSTGKQVDSSNSVPSWVWAFVFACGIIPIISVGGALPALLGFGGSGYCYTISQDTSKKVTTRVLMCFCVTLICWALFVVLILAIRK